MSVTGVALTYEKQMLDWADRREHPLTPPSAGARALSPETLLAAVLAAQPEAVPIGITRRADSTAAATVNLEGNRALLVDPHTGAILGEPASGWRRFFRTMTNWHRWLALDGASRSTGRLVTGLANLGFLFIVLSGLYLWLPRVRTWLQFTQVLWFRRGLAGKARDFNWHNVIGIWSALPLAFVVAGAVPISFPWASNLVYRAVGEVPPPPQSQAGPGGPGGPGRSDAPGGPARPGSGERRGPREPGSAAAVPPPAMNGIDAAWARAEERVTAWRTISLRLGSPSGAPLAFTIDAGSGGQPQKRSTLTVDRATAQVAAWETFDDLSAGRRLRSWLRFVHTGEYYGLTGQTIAGLVSAGSAVLAYTGLALAWRRFWNWMRRRAQARQMESRAA